MIYHGNHSLEREREGVSFIDFWNKIKQEIIATIKIHVKMSSTSGKAHI